MGTSLPGAHSLSSWSQVQCRVQLVLRLPTEAVCLPCSVGLWSQSASPTPRPEIRLMSCVGPWAKCSLNLFPEQHFQRENFYPILFC